MIDWKAALTIFVGTLPLLLALILNLLDVKQVKTELIKIREDITSIKERLATLEERDRVRLR
jgi:hypothetical protein